MIREDYINSLEQRECRGGCGMKFKVLPTSPQWFARSNCATHCKQRVVSEEFPEPVPIPVAVPVLKVVPPPEPPKREPKLEIEISRKETAVPKAPKKVDPPKKDPPRMEAVAIENQPLTRPLEKEKLQPQPVMEVQPPHEPLDFHAKVPEKTARRTKTDSEFVGRFDQRLQQFWTCCIADAKKLLQKRDELASKMGVAYFALMDARMRGEASQDASLRAFALSIGLDAAELQSWIRVRQTVWERVINPLSMIDKYSFEDLLAVSADVKEGMDEKAVEAFIEERITNRYRTLVTDYLQSLERINHFYKGFSLELLNDDEFARTYEASRLIASRFRNYRDRRQRQVSDRQQKKARPANRKKGK